MKLQSKFAAVAAVAAMVTVGAVGTASAKDGARVKADGFTGVPQSLIGPAGNFAGFNGGGLPWAIGEAEVTVRRSGKVEVEFQDLVFAAGPNAGRNTLATMRVGVSCMDQSLTRTTALSDAFPVTTPTALDPVGGDADAVTHITLPASCLAPIVFITSAGGAWFAVGSL